jgi:hypothetical protein
MVVNLVSENAIINAPFGIALSSNLSSWLGYKCRKHTENGYSHAFITLGNGLIVSQDWTLQKYPIVKILNGTTRVKVFENCTFTQNTINSIKADIETDLQKPFYKRSYDIFNLLFRGLGITVNGPGEICSTYCNKKFGLGLPQPSPGDLDRWLKILPCWSAIIYDPTL